MEAHMDKSLYEFPVSIYGSLEKYNDVLSKARCRIFYKYENRNGTYISDEFAEKLLSTLPYAPVKGIYDDQNGDYSDHGTERDQGRIYGIVPENPNVAWEPHLDEDGVERIYACTDVLIFTALYEEASDIVGESQSMELYSPSLKYHEAIIRDRRFIVFDEGCFLGLQVLGDNTEPCFEGASFYTLQSVIENAINIIKNYGGTKMQGINFKLSDDQKFQAIWALLNSEYTEEGNWTVTYSISAIYDDYALAFSYETGEFYRAYYTKNDESDMVELGEVVKCYILDVTESEKQTLDTLRALNGGTYELVSEVLVNAQENLDKNSEFSAKIDELNETIATLNTENSGICERYDEAQQTIASLQEENESLNTYKLNIETQQKNAVIDEYGEHLDEEILNKYREHIADYTCEELDMHLAYELKKNNSSIFNKDENSGFVPKDVPADGITAILSKYKK
jgi:hypothetical protein